MRRPTIPTILLLVAASLAAALPAAGSAPAGPPGETVLTPPYVGTADAIEFTVTARPRVRFLVDAGWVEGPVDESQPEERSYDIQVRRAGMLAPRAPQWRLVSSGDDRRWHRFDLPSGRVVCVRARQHSYGLTSAWSRPSCLVRARDDSQARRSGSMHVVREPGYEDRRATRLTGGRLSMPGVPRGARYGFLVSEHGTDGNSYPAFGLAGGPLHYSCLGGTEGSLFWCARPARRAGTLVATSVSSDPVGGLVVIPRWANGV